MNTNHNNILTIAFILLGIMVAHAQTFIGEFDFNDEQQRHVLAFYDGNTITGKIISIENTTIIFLEDQQSTTNSYQFSELNKIMVAKSDLDLTTAEGQSIAQKDEQYKLKTYHPEVRGNNRLFYAPTGFMLRKKQLEYNTLWGKNHTLDYGLLNGLTVGIGVANLDHIWLHTQFNYIGQNARSKFRAGFDFQITGKPNYFIDDSDQKEKLGWDGYFKMSTYISIGSPNRNAHLGFSIVPIFDTEQFFNAGIVRYFSFGGTVKVAPHWKIIYENTFGAVEEDFRNDIFGVFAGLGANWFNQKNSFKFGVNSSPNFGILNVPIDDFNAIAALPFFSYSRYF